MLAGMFGLYEKEWQFKTPAFLGQDASFLSTLDLSSAIVVAAVYSLLADIPSFRPVKTYLLFSTYYGSNFLPSQPTTALEARTVATVVLGIMLGSRVVWMYGSALWEATGAEQESSVQKGKRGSETVLDRVPEKVDAALVEGKEVEVEKLSPLEPTASNGASPRRRVKVKGKKA